jgi:hypothetical protein
VARLCWMALMASMLSYPGLVLLPQGRRGALIAALGTRCSSVASIGHRIPNKQANQRGER